MSVSVERTDSGAISEAAGATAAERSAVFTVSLGRELVAGETVDVPLVLSGSGVAAADVSLSFTSGEANTGASLRGGSSLSPVLRLAGAGARVASLTVTASDDSVDEGTGETLTVALGDLAASGRATNVAGGVVASDDGDPVTVDNSFEVVIADDDMAGLVAVVVGDGLRVSEPSGTDTLLVALASQPTGDVTVTVTSGDSSVLLVSTAGGAKAASVQLTFTPVKALVSQAVTVHAVDDNVDNTGNVRDVVVSVSSSSSDTKYAGLSETVNAKVADDDLLAAPVLPLVQFTQASHTAGEAAGDRAVSLALSVSPAPSKAVTVRYTVSGTATSGDDFTALSGSVVVEAGASTASIPVAVLDDTTDEPPETVVVTLDASGSYRLGSTAAATVTVADDDATVVRLARVDRGAITETKQGSSAKTEAEFTVTLGRALKAGEVIEVPLVLSALKNSGSDVTAADVDVAKKTGASINKGVTVAGSGSLTPTVTFTGNGTDTVRTATLLLTSPDDSAQENQEKVTVELGPNDDTTNGFDNSGRATNVGGGADPHRSANSFLVAVFDVDRDPVEVTLAQVGSSRAVEGSGETVQVEVTLGRALAAGEVAEVPVTVQSLTGSFLWGPARLLARVRALSWEATGDGVSLKSDLLVGSSLHKAALVVLFTGSDDNTVQTATITFTAENGDSDSRNERTVVRIPNTGSSLNAEARRTNLAGGLRLGNRSVAAVNLIEPGNEVVATLSVNNNGVVAEGGMLTVTVDLSGSAGSAVNLPVRMSDTGLPTASEADFALGNNGVVEIGANARSGAITFTANRDNNPEGDEFLALEFGKLPAGVVAAETSPGRPKTAKVTITDADAGTPVTVTMAASDGDSDGNAVEGAGDSTGYRTVTITLGRALTGSETVTVPLTVVGATITTDYTFGLQPTSQTGVSLTTSGGTHTAQNPAVVFTSGARTATLRLTPVNNNARTQPYLVVGYGSGDRVPGASVATLGEVSGDPIGVVLVDDETGDIEVPSNWALVPSGLSGGDEFRLMFMTSAGRAADSTDISDYDGFVRMVGARSGHSDVLSYVGFFKVFASTRSSGAPTLNVAGRGHVGMWQSSDNTWTDGSTSASGSGTPIYWLGGTMIADNYFDFCDSSWDNRWSSGTNHLRHEDGNVGDGSKVWTGMNNNCTLGADPLGDSSQVSWGPGTQTASGGPLNKGQEANTNTNRLYGMSPVFKVAAAAVPELTFAQATYSVAESGGAVTVTVNATSAPSTALVVNLNSQDGGTTAGLDYTAPGTSFAFPASITTHTFSIAITDDNFLEANEAFTLTLAAANDSSYTVGSQATTTVTITDNDTATIELSAASYTVLEGAGTASVTVEVTSSPNTVEVPLTVTLTPANGTATGASGGTGADFDSDAVTVTGTKGSNTVSVAIPITDDIGMEVDETFTVTLSTTQTRVSEGTQAMATVTIADNDNAKGLVFTPAAVTVAEGGTASYAVHPTEAPTGDVTVSVTVPAGDLTIDTNPSMAGTQTAALTFTTLDWYIGQTIEVSAAQDPDAVNDTVTLTHSPTGGGYTSSHNADLTVTIEDTNDPIVRIEAGTSPVTEGTAASFTVTATPAPSADLDVVVTVEDAPSSDFIASADQTDHTVTITGGQTTKTLTVNTTADSTDEADGAVKASVKAGTGYTVSSSAAVGMVTVEDDDPTVVSLGRVDSGSIAEGGSGTAENAEFTVTLGRQLVVGETVEVPLVLSGTDVTASDVAVAKKTGATLNKGVTLAGGSTLTPTVTFGGHATDTVQTATLVLTASGDDTTEASETVTVALGPDGTGTNGFDLSSRATNVGGGANPHGSNNSFNVGIDAQSVTVTMAASDGDSDGNAVEGAGDSTGYRTVTITLGAGADGFGDGDGAVDRGRRDRHHRLHVRVAAHQPVGRVADHLRRDAHRAEPRRRVHLRRADSDVASHAGRQPRPHPALCSDRLRHRDAGSKRVERCDVGHVEWWAGGCGVGG